MPDEATTHSRQWYGPFLRYLLRVRPKSHEDAVRYGGRGDPGAFAAVRNATRGGRFATLAFPHIIPYLDLEESGTWLSDRRLQAAMIVGSAYAAYPPRLPGTTEEEDQKSIGWYLGIADGRSRAAEGADDDPKKRTPLERELHVVVSSHFDVLPKRLRSVVSRIANEKVEMRHADYALLLRDIAYWDAPESPVQKQWVRDFYRGRYSAKTNTKESTE